MEQILADSLLAGVLRGTQLCSAMCERAGQEEALIAAGRIITSSSLLWRLLKWVGCPHIAGKSFGPIQDSNYRRNYSLSNGEVELQEEACWSECFSVTAAGGRPRTVVTALVGSEQERMHAQLLVLKWQAKGFHCKASDHWCGSLFQWSCKPPLPTSHNSDINPINPLLSWSSWALGYSSKTDRNSPETSLYRSKNIPSRKNRNERHSRKENTD